MSSGRALGRVTSLLVAALLVCAACGSAGGGSADDDAVIDPDGPLALAGRTFVATEVTEAGQPRPLVEGTQLEVSFDEGTVRWRAGCNSFGAPVSFEGDRLAPTEEVGGTAMGCDQPRMDQDEWLVSFVQGGPTVGLDGDTLTLSSGDTTIVLVDRASVTTDVDLAGTTWVLESIVDGTTASSVPTGVTATLVLGADGSTQGTGTCNGYGGSYSVDGETITFTPGPTTLIGCPPDEARVEGAVAATLRGPVAWSIDGDQLTLAGPDGHGLVYRAA